MTNREITMNNWLEAAKELRQGHFKVAYLLTRVAIRNSHTHITVVEED